MAAKPTVINRAQNHVVISFKNVEKRVLEKLDEVKKWAVVYKGEKEEVRVGGLAPCTCYFFRVKGEGGEWVEFKGATTEGPFLIMHLARAVKVGKTALLDIQSVQNIVLRPILLEVENREMKTPLVLAVEKNDPSMVSLLITLGANVNIVTYYTKRSLLMVALSLGYIPIAQLLIDKGCNVNTTDINGLNILHVAVDFNNVNSVEFALKHVTSVDSKDNSGWTPLLRAAILNCSDEVINCLLDAGASKFVKDKNGFDFDKHRQMSLKLL